MAFGSVETPPVEKKPFNIDSVDTSSNQQAIVVPYFAGVKPCTVDWVEDLTNVISRPVPTGGGGKGGKGGSGGADSQKNWYGNIAGVTNVCTDDAPNDAIVHIIVNGEPVLGGTDPLNPAALTRVPGQHYVSFAIPKFSTACRFYWGTKDQPIDDLILSHLANKHGAYRNQGLFVAKQWFLGSAPNLQTIVIVLARGAKFFSSRFETAPAGVNPWGPVYELLTDPLFGNGLPEARLDPASFIATADAMTADGILLSPQERGAKGTRSLLADYFQYFDGFVFRDGINLKAGYFTHGDIDLDSLPALGSDEIIGEPQIKQGDLSETTNATFVTYNNRAKWYKDDDTDRYIDQENFEKQGIQVDDRLSRPAIIDGALAVRHGVEWGKIHAIEPATGTITCRRDQINGLRPGRRFKSNIASLSLSFAWRILAQERSSSRAGSIKFTLQNERSLWPELFLQPPAPVPVPIVIVPFAIAHARVRELPSGLKNAVAGALQVAILAQRPTTHILGMKVHVSPDDSIYEHIYTQYHFAAYGLVAVAYPLSTADLDLTVGIVVDLSGEDKEILSSQTDSERDNNHLLLFVDGEIMSVGQVIALGSDRFKLFPRRARYGTAKDNHFIGAVCYFVLRYWLLPMGHASFIEGATRYFKLQPFTFGADYDLDLVPALPYTFAGGAVSPIFNLALTTRAQVIAGAAESRITATWGYVLDQDIATFDVAIKRALDSEFNWQTRSTGASPFTDWVVQPATYYMVKVRPVNSLGEPGAWCTPVSILSASISPFSVTGLELEGQGNDTECHGRDFNFACRLNSPGTGIDPGGGPIPPGVNDPQFDHFLWRVLVGDSAIYQEATTAPHFQFTYEKNVAASAQAGLSGPQPLITCQTFAIDTFQNASLPALLTVRNSPPVAPGNVHAFAAQNRTVLITWTNGSEPDLQSIRILRGTAANPALAQLVGTISAVNDLFVDTLPNAVGTVVFNYWLRAVDTFGLQSPLSVGVSASSDPIPAPIPDIEDLEVQLSQIYRNVVILRSAVLSANTPGAGSIAWNAHKIMHNGVLTDIAAGNTALKYVYWNIGAAVYVGSDTQLSLGETRFLILQNAAGTPRPLWNFFANAVIGNASILDASIVDAHIVNVSATRVTAGIILGQEIVLRNQGLIPCTVRTYDYVPGVSGAALGIDADGIAFLEAWRGLFRGQLSIGGSNPATAPFRVNSSGDLFCRNATIEDALYVNTLTPPVFVNALAGSAAITSRNYNDDDDISLKITAPSGKKVRFEIGTDKRVNSSSPYWPNAANTGDGVGPSDFLGFVFNYVAGNYHGRVTRRTTVATESGSFLSEERSITLVYVPVAGLGLPAAPAPFIVSASDGIGRGEADYQVDVIIPEFGGAPVIFVSLDAGANYAPYASGSIITLGKNESVFAFVTALGYVPSAVTVFYNTEVDTHWPDPGWNGPPGTFPP